MNNEEKSGESDSRIDKIFDSFAFLRWSCLLLAEGAYFGSWFEKSGSFLWELMKIKLILESI